MPNFSRAQNLSLLILVAGVYVGLSGLYLKLQGALESATESEKALGGPHADSVMNVGGGMSIFGVFSLFFSTVIRSGSSQRTNDSFSSPD